MKKHRSSQIAWTVVTVHVHITCMQKVLHEHENPCTLLIPLCKNNLNLPMCFFFLPHAWLPPPLVHHVVMLATSLRCADFVCWFVFTENVLAAQPKTRYLLVNLKAGFHSSYFADRKNIIEYVCWVHE